MQNFFNTFKQPKAFYLIWLIELWERFGFYGMQAILVLYLVKELGFTDNQAYNTFGAFSALLYAYTSIGGYIGDHILGTKRTITLGAIVLCLGYIVLSLSNANDIYISLGIIVAGNGLFKANPASLLAKLYPSDDPKIDGAFTLYYMSINLGSFVSISVTPFIAKYYNWNIAFFLSAIGLIVGIINYLALIKWANKAGSPPDFEKLNYKKLILIIILVILLSMISTFLLKALHFAHLILAIAGIVVLIIFIKEIITSKDIEKAKLIACLVLIIEAIFFFTLYQQMPTSLNLFAVRNVQSNIFGFAMAPAAYQALNPLWIILASPILAFIYDELGKRNKDLTLPTKFTLGMFLCSIGFLILSLSINFSNQQGIVSAYWLIASYGFQSIGELLVSGLGCAMIAKLCPPKLMGFMMGVWFMSTAAAMVLGGYVASIATIPENITNPLTSLEIYTDFFYKVGIVTIVITVLMAIITPFLNKLCTESSLTE